MQASLGFRSQSQTKWLTRSLSDLGCDSSGVDIIKRFVQIERTWTVVDSHAMHSMGFLLTG
jgi:hypothetical protein